MSLSQSIAPHLPYLRRFARALCGSQSAGDAQVVAVLEMLIADPDSFDRSLDARVSLYQVFVRYWNTLATNQTRDEDDADKTAPADRLGRLTPRSRQAFLLTSVEGFSDSDACTILGIDGDGLSQLIDEAGHEIAAQVTSDVLIIEDEPIIAMDLEALVTSLGHNVTGMARTHREAIQAATKHRPGLVLADIQLADGSSGLEAVNEMLELFNAPVVFITAYPERLLTGERPEPAFLITKPFQPDTVKAVISQALFFDQNASKRKEAV